MAVCFEEVGSGGKGLLWEQESPGNKCPNGDGCIQSSSHLGKKRTAKALIQNALASIETFMTSIESLPGV